MRTTSPTPCRTWTACRKICADVSSTSPPTSDSRRRSRNGWRGGSPGADSPTDSDSGSVLLERKEMLLEEIPAERSKCDGEQHLHRHESDLGAKSRRNPRIEHRSPEDTRSFEKVCGWVVQRVNRIRVTTHGAQR